MEGMGNGESGAVSQVQERIVPYLCTCSLSDKCSFSDNLSVALFFYNQPVRYLGCFLLILLSVK